MANVRVPAAVVIDLLRDEVDYDHLTPRKRGRGQGPQVEGGTRARNSRAAGPSQAATIVLDDEAGSSDEADIIDLDVVRLADIRGKAPMQMQMLSKRSRGAYVDLTGDGEGSPPRHTRAAHRQAAPLGAPSQKRDHAARAEFLALENEHARHGAAFDERPGPSHTAAEKHQGSSQPIDVSGSQPDPEDMLGVGPVVQPREATFSCAVCYDDHPMEDCFIASMCKHRLCRDAAREVVLGAMKSCTFPVLCPICQAKPDPPCAKCERRRADMERAAAAGEEDNSGANGPSAWCCSLDADIPLLLSVEEEEQYLARSLKAATNACPDLLPCPRADCEGVAVGGEEDASQHVICNVCQHGWCKSCKVDWHDGLNCNDYQRQAGEAEADKGLAEYQKANKMVRCPTCGHGIEKITGCNRVTCTGCKTQVCWLCGDKLPATNPYSHFTSKGCPNVGGGTALIGAGVPAGAWAGVQGAPGAAPAPQPAAAAAAVAPVVAAAAPRAAAAAHPPNPPAAAPNVPNWLPIPRNHRAQRRKRNRR
ncbi:hypothetical protein COCSUDRAFT_57197 [Coccomyxa subellipsoidea C-169]|uniref:RBR-type E3 ubiquitin transferase n=1 Tax=Coccomyxa subellipsoidea (strain C-169) TaxID=574566 RepID=I0YQF7_COCSC|nr:hypothetical protein COCSUDRAFT_57197 [Coccomyxa subellipsoidea C-169]EIE20626.1 hypothetical protein COCSUDRAFT_57197 [Coccomyxa subellipsoidea C-169]|eukprot:XP_005645170.1 hypothetical protein COCSUDRAFT_57197 [Coccomyxa subellipsoidea C-169]